MLTSLLADECFVVLRARDVIDSLFFHDYTAQFIFVIWLTVTPSLIDIRGQISSRIPSKAIIYTPKSDPNINYSTKLLNLRLRRIELFKLILIN